MQKLYAKQHPRLLYRKLFCNKASCTVMSYSPPLQRHMMCRVHDLGVPGYLWFYCDHNSQVHCHILLFRELAQC